MANAMRYHADYHYHNVTALEPLVREHGVELRTFPDEVAAALGQTSLGVLDELAAETPLTRKIHGSCMKFLQQANPYSQWFDLRMLQMRAATLGPI